MAPFMEFSPCPQRWPFASWQVLREREEGADPREILLLGEALWLSGFFVSGLEVLGALEISTL